MSEVNARTAQYSCTIAGTTYEVLWFSMQEEMSGLFRLSVTIWEKDPSLSISGWMRKSAEVKVAWGDFEKTYYGLVVSCSRVNANETGLGGTDEPWGEYTVEIQPTLWLLDRQSNCKIFQEMSSDEIVRAVLDARGMAGKYEMRLSLTYPKREYCVQYRESDLAFISRLMEEEGIFYYFTHEGREMMVIGDSVSAYGTCAPEDSVEYKGPSGQLATEKEYLSSITYVESAHSGKVKLMDFDYRSPSRNMRVEQCAEQHDDLELYDYHCERYLDDRRGRTLAKVLTEVESLWRKTITAAGTFRSLSSGCTLTISKAYHDDLNGEWLVVSAMSTASQGAQGGLQSSASFTAIKADVTFRAVPRTPRPHLNLQTATVVGPQGQPIYMDELGRAKVQFNWDLDGRMDENSSCWIRVAQPYAGVDPESQAKHGFQWHPLIGDKVAVEFLEGDPDRPLIVGSIYDAERLPPIRPEDHIRNIVLSPYQHRLLMDDKNTSLTLNTGGREVLEMVDKAREEGRVTLETVGRETITLEDNHEKYGNTIHLVTADDHQLRMAEKGDYRGAQLSTKSGHKLTLNDAERRVTIQSADGHLIALDDQNQQILIRSRDGHRVELNDRDRFIEIEDSSQQHRIRIDTASSSIQVTTSGSMSLDAGGGMTISADSVTISATRSIDVTCVDFTVTASNSISFTAGSQYSVTAGSISESATSISMNAATSIDSTAGATNSMTAGASAEVTAGGTAKVEAGGLVQVNGALVKIN